MDDLADAVAAALDTTPTHAADILTRLTNAGWELTRITRPHARTLAEAFAQRTQDAGNGHLDWTGFRDRDGRPRYQVAGTAWTGMRLAWATTRTRPPDGNVRADCDHPGCVAPEHLTDRRDRDLTRAVLGTPRRRARPA
ncbi:hypothetical protein B4N89_02435 [Embleya scabrispora]|uniref:HNH endonuclease n=1 Tax=Embleya scabrispora TaxID=159449 RepID=A0A1T3NT78_9ACTN|nr:hypothetical protein [Embleya scabrispora]OPC79955.1 hypothetical protein B4N89_02435 [Embleya scabrispora]